MTDKPSNLWGREPAMVVALIEAIIVLLLTFGLTLSAPQIGAILAVVTLALGIITRSQVTPVKNPDLPFDGGPR
jgi:hypothetical protein